MRTIAFLVGTLLALDTAFADASDYTAQVDRVATLRIPPSTFDFPPPSPPFTFIKGTHLRIVSPSYGPAGSTVHWFKNGQDLGVTGLALDLPSVAPSDSGSYSTITSPVGAGPSFGSPRVDVLVTSEGPRLLNLSTLGYVDPSHGSLVAGFVVEPSPTEIFVLVRAIGPSLTRFGIAAPLAVPQLQLFDATGHAVQSFEPLPAGVGRIGGPAPTIAIATQQVGAFTLTPGTKDAVALYELTPGTYTAHVAAGTSIGGTALLEVYQVPLEQFIGFAQQ